jgi:Macrocin-O-methyltransferase (TylF)
MLLAESPDDRPSVAALRLQQIIEARFRDGIEDARAVGARRAQGDAEALRAAYLDVVKLALCDLGGSRTTSVARTQRGDVMSRELVGEALRLRAAGLDWPLHGLTMVGLRRLDDLQACVESVVRDDVPGDLIEAGSWRGGASLLMRATLNALGVEDRTVWVSDSFQGFPQAEGEPRPGYDLSVDLAGADFLAVPIEEVRANFARFGCLNRVEFVPGFFQDTLPSLSARTWSLVRLDGDTYDSVMVGLRSLYPGLSVGGYLVVDDYLALDQCREAVDDFRRELAISEPIEEIDWSGARWRRTSVEPTPTRGVPQPERAAGASLARPVERPNRGRIPAIEEVQVREELTRVQAQLTAAEAEILRLTSSPIHGPKRWLRDRVGSMRGGR